MEHGLSDSQIMMPHGHCYLWREELLWTHVLSDGLIAAAYASIPAALVYLVWKRKDIEFDWMFMLFGVFILACGTTHVLAIISVWEPIYYLSAALKVVTAAASVGTAVVLWPLIPKILLIPSPSQLQAVNEELADEVEQHRSARVRLLEQSKELKNQAAQLIASNQELSEANEMARAYFNAAATEIQGPVAVADTDLDRVRSCLEGGLVQDGKEILGSVRLRLRGVQRSVERVLAKASVSMWEPEFQECAVAEIVEQIQHEYGLTAESGSGQLEILGSLPTVSADRVGLKLVLNNCVESILSKNEEATEKHLGLTTKPIGFSKELGGPAWEILLTSTFKFDAEQQPSLPDLVQVKETEEMCNSVMTKQGGVFSFMIESERLVGARLLLPAVEKATFKA